MFIQRIKDNYKFDEPIFIENILALFPEFTRAYVFRLIKQAETNGELIKFSRGVYYIPKKTFFGYSTLTSSMVANNKYITDGKSVYGIYSGLTLLNQFLVSTQIPNVIEIVTNNEATRKRIVNIDGMRFVVRKSRFEITNDNYNYYSLLQFFLELGIKPNLDKFAKQKIKKYMKEKRINQERLIRLAMKFPAQTLKNLIGSGVISGTKIFV